jgi:hypothetical protein
MQRQKASPKIFYRRQLRTPSRAGEGNEDFPNLNPTATLVISGSRVVGEKRYWLQIALARDLNADRTVDVLGAELEEVTE